MKKSILLIVLFSGCLTAVADNRLIPLLKERIINLSCHPFFQSKDLNNLATSISNKGNVNDNNLMELYWNTYQQDSDLVDIIKTQLPDGSWKDINYSDPALSNWDPTNHLSRLLYLSRAYITPKSKFYHQKSVSGILHKGLNYWFQRKPVCKNWWYNQIGVPRLMGLIFLFIEKEMTSIEKSEAVVVMNNSRFRMTGQNKVWLAGNVMLKALLTNDENLVRMARDTIASEILITTREGIQPDYSFHQHGPQQQFGNYGLSFISSMAYYANILSGTSLTFSPSQIKILRNFIFEGENWVVWHGYMDVSACNRQLFKQAQVGKALALCSAVNQIKQADLNYSKQYDDLLKRNLYTGSIPEKAGSKHFWLSDLTVFRGTKSYISIRACSPRVIGTEFTNNENKKGHFISDGGTIFMRNGNEYKDIFPIWDWNKIPGVTAPVLDSIKPNTDTDKYYNPNSFVGGLTRNVNGISTFHLVRNKVEGMKSWFYINGIMVCLGADIHSNNGKEIITTVNQCNQYGQVLMTLNNGKSSSTNDTLINSKEVNSVWHDSIGYYFPKQTSTSLSVQKQQGNWHDIADPYSSDMIAGKVFKLWINHGINALSPSYEYLVLPAISPKQLDDYIYNPKIEILANNKIVQGVKLKNNSLFQFIFHEPTRITTFTNTDFVESRTPGIVMIERDELQNLLVSVVDPTQNQKAFRLNVSGKYESQLSNYNITSNQTELMIPLPQHGNAGSMVTVELKRILKH